MPLLPRRVLPWKDELVVVTGGRWTELSWGKVSLVRSSPRSSGPEYLGVLWGTGPDPARWRSDSWESCCELQPTARRRSPPPGCPRETSGRSTGDTYRPHCPAQPSTDQISVERSDRQDSLLCPSCRSAVPPAVGIFHSSQPAHFQLLFYKQNKLQRISEFKINHSISYDREST